MCRIVIPAIWDVFWDQTDLLRTLVRPPNTLSQNNRNPKKKFFGLFLPSQKGSTGRYNKTVSKMPTNGKKSFFFFADFKFCEFWWWFSVFYMNVVILGCKVNDDEILCLCYGVCIFCSIRRMKFIHGALQSWVSQLSNALSPMLFGHFLTLLRHYSAKISSKNWSKYHLKSDSKIWKMRKHCIFDSKITSTHRMTFWFISADSLGPKLASTCI